MGIEIDFFAQTNESAVEHIDGVSVKTFSELLMIQEELKILVCIKNSKATCEIKTMINQVKRPDIKVYDMASFIETNLFKRAYQPTADGNKYCIICNNNLDTFEPAGIEQELFRNKHIIGGGLRDNCICPLCGCNDRERWLYYVLKNKTNLDAMNGRVLHFAPERSISEMIQANGSIDYYTGDINPGRGMHVTDITCIQYKEEIFDYVICNHVMEHIKDENKAVSEVMRVLKHDGKWIFSIPICTDIDKTYEDNTIISPVDRLREYGQEDHVRLYGKDFKERFEKYGLKIKVFSPEDELTEEEINRYGFIKDDIIMIASKQ